MDSVITTSRLLKATEPSVNMRLSRSDGRRTQQPTAGLSFFPFSHEKTFKGTFLMDLLHENAREESLDVLFDKI